MIITSSEKLNTWECFVKRLDYCVQAHGHSYDVDFIEHLLMLLFSDFVVVAVPLICLQPK